MKIKMFRTFKKEHSWFQYSVHVPKNPVFQHLCLDSVIITFACCKCDNIPYSPIGLPR